MKLAEDADWSYFSEFRTRFYAIKKREEKINSLVKHKFEQSFTADLTFKFGSIQIPKNFAGHLSEELLNAELRYWGINFQCFSTLQFYLGYFLST